MKKEQIFELMNAIPPDLVEEADVQAPAKRRRPRLAPAGLIAACLCLALIGTAAAVHYFGVRLVDGPDGFTDMRGGVTYHPYDSLSDQIKALSDQDTVKSFNSWQAAENFIGVDLMNNPVLDAAATQTHSIRIERGSKTVRDVCVMYINPGLSSITTLCCYQMDNVDIILESHLYTEHMAETWEDWDETFTGIRFLEGSEVSQDTYTSSNGLVAQILEAHTPRNNYPDSFYSYGVFSLNGVPTIVKCDSDNSLEEARAALHQILDGFILE